LSRLLQAHNDGLEYNNMLKEVNRQKYVSWDQKQPTVKEKIKYVWITRKIEDKKKYLRVTRMEIDRITQPISDYTNPLARRHKEMETPVHIK
jgi:hypothetical protein